MVTLGLIALAGCGAGGGGGAEGDGEGEGGPTIGVTIQNATNPFFKAEERGAEAAAKEIGAEVLFQHGNQDVATQTEVVDSFIRQQVDAIVIDAVDTTALGPAIERAKQADIPVVAIDVGAEGADVTITTDNVQAGEIACEYMAEQIDGEGQVGILNGTPITSVTDRVKGCNQALDRFPDIEVVANQRSDNSRDGGLAVGGDMLTANPGIRAIFAINDPGAIGVELAAEQRGITSRDELILTAVDGAKEAADSIKSDDGLMVATSAQDPEGMGRQGVVAAAKLAAGETVEPKTKLIPAKLITEENVDSYEPWGEGT
jgi:ribose transport system substrate-binding protein